MWTTKCYWLNVRKRRQTCNNSTFFIVELYWIMSCKITEIRYIRSIIDDRWISPVVLDARFISTCSNILGSIIRIYIRRFYSNCLGMSSRCFNFSYRTDRSTYSNSFGTSKGVSATASGRIEGPVATATKRILRRAPTISGDKLSGSMLRAVLPVTDTVL